LQLIIDFKLKFYEEDLFYFDNDLLTILNNLAYSQTSETEHQQLVKGFLKDHSEPNWIFDSLSSKYILFRSDESPNIKDGTKSNYHLLCL